MGLRIKIGMRLVYCGSSEHMKGVKGVVINKFGYGNSMYLDATCGSKYSLPTNTGVWEEEKVTAPTEKAGDTPCPHLQGTGKNNN